MRRRQIRPFGGGARGVDGASIFLDEGVDWDGCCSCVKVTASDHSTHSGIKSGRAGTMTTGDAGVFFKTHACLHVSYDENSSKSHTE